MNKLDRDYTPEGQAMVEYLDGEYQILRQGSYVLCAISGVQIPLDALRYWSVDLQEAYASPHIAHARFLEKNMIPK